jgi:cytochrome c oxidase cbb3-type subunit 1
MTYLFPRLLGASGWYRPSWNSWHFWLTTLATLVMFFDLAMAGLVQGFQWKALNSWEESLVASMPFWLVRLFSGAAIIVGQFIFACNIAMTAIHKRSVESTPVPEHAIAPPAPA